MAEKRACTNCGADGHTAAQCNWNKAGETFKREDRYFVIKRTDLVAADKAGKVAPAIFDAISAIGDILPHRDCLVIESDWPEYDTAWRMIEARVTGQAGSMVECPLRCGAMYANDSYGAGFIEGSGICPDCDAAMPAKDIVRTVQVCKLGTSGKAYDAPEAKRAYTYADQPDNLAASKLGRANVKASLPCAGDSIDRGLLLLRELQDQGFGVFELTPAPAQGGE